MTQPRPSTAQLLARLSRLEADNQRLADEVAQLRAGTETPTRQEFEAALRRLDTFDQRLHDAAEHHAEGETRVDLTPLQDRVQALEDVVAKAAAEAGPGPELAALTERLSTLERAAAEPPRQEQAPPPPPPNLSPLEARLQAVEDKAARLEAAPPPDPRIESLLERVGAVEAAAKERPRAEGSEDFQRQVLAQVAAATEKAEAAKQQAMIAQMDMVRMVEAVARDVADLRTVADGALAAGLASDALTKVNGKVDAIDSLFNVDATLFTAKTRTGFQVDTPALTDSAVETAKIANLAVTAAKLAASAVETDKINNLAVTAGKLAASAVETDKINNLAVTAGKLAASAVETDKINNGAVTNDKLASSGLDISKMTAGDLTLGAAQDIGVFGATPVGQQTRGATLTNSVTSGGSNDVIADFGLTDYATDGATIRNNIYQLARAVRMHDVALRAFGFET